jgi:hypothetical protein
MKPVGKPDAGNPSADCENAFDELKNHWGWGGFTTHDLLTATERKPL